MSFFKRSCTRQNVLVLAMIVAAIMVVFYPVLGKFAGLNAPDSPPHFPFPFRTLKLDELLRDGCFTPHNLYWLIFNPLYAHELSYIGDTLLLILGGFFYLRTLRVEPLAAWFGAVALGFSGYTFTLFSAGHRGYFHAFPCAVWALGFIARGFATRRLIWFAWLGVVYAWGVPHQPDVLLLMGGLAAAYVLWLTFKHTTSGSTILMRLRHVWPRFLVALLVLVLAGWGGLRSAVTTQIENRDLQIERSGQASQTTADKHSPEAQRERWLFATGWSMPPEDVLEFLVPGIFGNDSFQPPYPYWGRLGRPDDSVFQAGRMMPNYRQHTLYLGIVPLLFALYAVITYRRKRGARTDTAAQVPTADLSDTPFWVGVWLLGLILAFGSFTPFYRLFYALPYMDYIRAPVKFVHLVEVATAVLAGYGVQRFFFDAPPQDRKLLFRLTLLFLALMALGLLVAWSLQANVVAHITALGMGQAAQALGTYMVKNILRALVVIALTSGIVWLALQERLASKRTLLLGAVVAVALLDQTFVARHYVRALELQPLYHANAVVKALNSCSGVRPPSVVNYATRNTQQEWFSMSLRLNGVRNLVPSSDEAGTPYSQLFAKLQKETTKLWQILQARAVIVPWQSGAGLVRAGVLRPIFGFELGNGTVRQSEVPGEQTLLLAEVVAATEQLRFTQKWRAAIAPEQQLEMLTTTDEVVSDAPAHQNPTPTAATVEVVAARGRPATFATRVKVETQAPGLLIFDERLAPRHELLIDGKPAPLYTANALWPAALVPAGQHEVTLRFKHRTAEYLLGCVVALLIGSWQLAVVWRKVG